MKKLFISLAMIGVFAGAANADVTAPQIPSDMLNSLWSQIGGGSDGDIGTTYLQQLYEGLQYLLDSSNSDKGAKLAAMGAGFDIFIDKAKAESTNLINGLNGVFVSYTNQINAAFASLDLSRDLMISAHTSQIGELSKGLDAINASVSAMNDGLDSLRSDFYDLDEKLSAGVAISNALSGLDNHLDAGKQISIGFGSGYYNKQGGFAFGGAFRTSVNSAFNAGVSVSTYGSVGAKAGWNMQF
ncbi:MAG: YadA C-terminal domain-containing protein [Rickettsiales bacterium]|jgi:hypothetical protein|nr:YadA C-terminal domain-containing protein [Rickettsiales bacterium]